MRKGSIPDRQEGPLPPAPLGVHYRLVFVKPSDLVSLPATPHIDKSPPTGTQLICFPSIDPCGKSPLAAALPASSASLCSSGEEGERWAYYWREAFRDNRR